MRKNERRANHTIIAHSVDNTFIHQDVQETAPEPFSALVSGVLMLGRLRLAWLLLSAAQCGEKIYCGWYLSQSLPPPEGAELPLQHSSQQPLPILSLEPTVSV